MGDKVNSYSPLLTIERVILPGVEERQEDLEIGDNASSSSASVELGEVGLGGENNLLSSNGLERLVRISESSHAKDAVLSASVEVPSRSLIRLSLVLGDMDLTDIGDDWLKKALFRLAVGEDSREPYSEDSKTL